MLRAYIKAENIKNAHSVLAKLWWLMSLVSICLAAANATYYQINQYNWWYSTLYPMLILLVASFVVQREKKLKNRAMGVLETDMKKLWTAKIVYCIKELLFAAAFIFIAQEVISRLIGAGGVRQISTGQGLFAAILWVVLSLWQIPFWLFVNQITGFGVTIVLGMACNIGLGLMGAMSQFWLLNPFAYINRLMCPVLKILPNGLPAAPGNQTFIPEVLDKSVISTGVAASLILFAVLYLLTAIWYKRKGEAGWEN